MPVLGNAIMYVLLARQVDQERRYTDLYEIRTDPLKFMLFNPCGESQVREYLSQDEMLAKLASWPVREPRHDQPRLPYDALPSRAWRGWARSLESCHDDSGLRCR